MTPRVSIVIEWDNIALAGARRAQAMLRRLAAELGPAPPPLEILLCHESSLHPDLSLDEYGLPPVWRAIPVAGARYYQLKNQGAARSAGEIIVFLDSDVIPDPGWLSALLQPFDDPRVQVVAGHAYIDPTTTYSKAFALTWFFPLRASPAPLQPVTHFFANNVAFRRATLLAHPFPEQAGVSRGACLQLAAELGAAGIAIWKTTAAQVSHPAPRGGRHFVLRALAQGRDRLLREHGWKATPIGSFVRYAANCSRGLLLTFRGRARVGLSWPGVPAVLAICWAYYSLYLVGEILTMLRIPAMRRIQI
jgi:hypothetical protein